MSFFKKRGIKGLIFSLVATIILLIIDLTGILGISNNFFMDIMYQRDGGINPDIKIIGIDDKTLNELGKMDTWDRSYYAELVKKLNNEDHKPSAIGFDILFTGHDATTSGDLAFSMECKKHDNIICGMNLLFNDTYAGDFKDIIIEASYPYEELNEVVEVGYVNTSLDKHDSYVRRVVPNINNNKNSYSSLSYKLYEKYMSYHNKPINKYDDNKYYYFDYSAKPNKSYSVLSFVDVLKGRIPLSDFEGSLVLVGAYTTGLQDEFYTPIKRGEKMNGVEIHANIIDAYTKDGMRVDINKILGSIILALIIFIITYIIYSAKPIMSTIILILSIGLFLGLQSIFYVNRIYYPMINPIIIIILSFIFNIGYSYFSERAMKLKTIGAFKKYVAPEVIESVYKNGDYKINLGGEKRSVACLFVDIRGFTPLSESLSPEVVVEILNEYLSLVTKAIFDNGGTLDKFIGDAAMALFNAPFSLEDYVYRACKTAVDIRSGAKALDESCLLKYDRSVGFGIGVNCGDAVVGNIGSDFRMDYTAIGDTINTAARLEGTAKRNEILISEAVYNIIKDRIECEYVGELTLKGKSKLLPTYKIIRLKEE